MIIKWNENLRTLRVDRGLSQQEVAEKIGISRTGYANYEQGTREPSFDVLRKICDYFDVSADYLIGRIDNY